MKTIELKIYKFDELSETAKNTAIEQYRHDDYLFMDFFHDDAKEQITEAGFKGNVSLQYSLSCSQGDGLSFSADYYDKLNELFIEVLGIGKQKTIDCIINNFSFKLKGNEGRYCYASESDITLELENCYVKSQNNIDIVIDKVRERLECIYMDICSNLEKQGYNEIDWQNSDECISENIIANDYEFTENGQIY